MQTYFIPLLAALALPLAAQSSRVERPLSLEAGLFLPNYNRLGPDAGIYAAAGYAFPLRPDVTLVGQVRGAYQSVSQGGASGDGGFNPIPPGDLTVLSLFVNARYQPTGSRLFGGAGLGIGRANRVDADGHTGLLFALEGGYDLSKSVYVTARYEFAGADTLRAGYVGLGFRL